MSQLRCAVIGVGHLGQYHAEKYNKIKQTQLSFVCDTNQERVNEVAQKLGTKPILDYKALVGQVDAVTIASITTTHYQIAKFFLENNIHVHVEKPMTSTSIEAHELCELADSKGLKLQVGHVERFNPALLSAHEQLKTPLFIECHRLAPFKPRGVDVDVVLDLMIHDLDVILSLVKSEPVKISAVGTPVLTNTTDIANARVEFASGTVANITASRVSLKSQRKFRVFQPSQYLSMDFDSREINLLTKTEGEWNFEEDDWPIETKTWSLEKGDALLAETQSFVDAINNNTKPIVSGQDGLVALKLAEDIIEKIHSTVKNA